MKRTLTYLTLILFFYSCSDEEPLSLTNQSFEVEYRITYFEPTEREDEGVATINFQFLQADDDWEYYSISTDVPELEQIELGKRVLQVDDPMYDYWPTQLFEGRMQWNKNTNRIKGDFWYNILGDYNPSTKQRDYFRQWSLTISSINE